MIVKMIQNLENKMLLQINSLETRIEKMQERRDFPGGSYGKVSVYNTGDLGSKLQRFWENPLEKEMTIHSSTIA